MPALDASRNGKPCIGQKLGDRRVANIYYDSAGVFCVVLVCSRGHVSKVKHHSLRYYTSNNCRFCSSDKQSKLSNSEALAILREMS